MGNLPFTVSVLTKDRECPGCHKTIHRFEKHIAVSIGGHKKERLCLTCGTAKKDAVLMNNLFASFKEICHNHINNKCETCPLKKGFNGGTCAAMSAMAVNMGMCK